MATLTLTSDYSGNKVQLRGDLILAMESIENDLQSRRNKTRLHLKGGTYQDVLESIKDLRKLL